jgi:hypothetical protein
MLTSYANPVGPALDAEEFVAILSCYFDESGKFHDAEIVSFCGFATPIADLDQFNKDWMYWVRKNGLIGLSMKDVLNHKRPLSERNKSTGLQKRIETLTPFVECIRDHFELGVGMAVDVGAFKALPSHVRKILGNDTHYTAFERAMHEISAHLLPPSYQASIIVDDEEKYAVECYKLLCRMKRARPEVRTKIVSIAFADDQYYPALQAADMLSSLTRMKAKQKFHGASFEYEGFYKILVEDSSKAGKIVFKGGFFGSDPLSELADKIQRGPKGGKAVKHLGPDVP